MNIINIVGNIAIPNSIENSLFPISKVVLISIVAFFSTSQIAANGVAQNFWSMAALFSLAMKSAFITVIGQCRGAKDLKAANCYIQKLLKITLIGGIIWNILFFTVTLVISMLYDLPNKTI